ncbi:small ribosomal protein [Salix suchowensis]|nr:small ribosomal protein [Salix suchowensis]
MRSQGQAQDPVHKGPNISTATWCSFPVRIMLGLRGSVRLLTEINQSLVQNATFRYQRVQGLRVGNTEIPNDKKLEVALQYINGIGRKRDLTGIELNSLREEVSKYLTGPDLIRRVKADVQRLVDIECYRGFRHVEGLPCRGQRTSTNARTRKEHQKYGSQEVAERIRKHQERSQAK